MPDQNMLGYEQLAQQLVLMGEAALPALAAGLYLRGEAIMAVSREERVPVDEGVLKGSGHVALPEINGNEVSVTLSYGGPAQAYALVQHENTTYHHTVGGAKYLEGPLLEAGPTLPADLAADVQAAYERLTR